MDGIKKVLQAKLLQLDIPRDDSKPTEMADGIDVAASVVIIKPGDEDVVVDEEGVLNLLYVRQQKMYKMSSLVLI